MIRNKELRIGNLVLIEDEVFDDNGKFNKTIHKIKGNDLIYTETEFYGIPLSEEILLKVGFQRHDEGSVSAQFSIGINPITHDYILYLIWPKALKDYSLEDFPFFKNGHHRIQYLHQLQNLYFVLTGQELNTSGL